MSARVVARGLAYVLAATTALGVSSMLSGAPSGATSSATPGSQGIDTSLPATDSQVTVSGRGDFSSLRITVNQTAKLNNQAVSITWTGGASTVQAPGRFGENYLQIFQCWGDDDGTNTDNPGPPPEQCVQGAVGGNYNGAPVGVYPNILATTRVIYRSNWAGYDPAVGYTDTRTTNVWMPFRSVTGEIVNVEANPRFNPAIVGGNYWLNPYFNEITTNEIAGGFTDSQGKGAELFQVDTGNESTGLGCGQKVQHLADGSKKVPQCWIVVVPRGTAAAENAGTPYGGGDPEQFGVATSPLSPLVWQHRIAIPIGFNPVDSPCNIARQDRRIAGNELALQAVSSWQPVLCTTGGLPPYSYAPISDDSARGQIANPAAGSPGLAVVSKPLAAGTFDSTKPVVYAPLTASGLVIGFNVERIPGLSAPPAEQGLAGVRVADINLTPRLLAKLMTQSYINSVALAGVVPSFAWLTDNAVQMGTDPDFLQYNPEFALLQNSSFRNFSALTVPAGASDAATQVWNYILADPEAKAWLSGTPDPWGMKVNPAFAADATLNPSGVAFGDPVPNSFPKSDPYCYQAPALGSVVPAPLCGTDWLPYTSGFTENAHAARVATDGARVEFNIYAATPADAWKRETPQPAGYRSFLALTDTPSAFKFGLQMARLSRAGDDGSNRRFIAPDTAGLTAGIAAMAAGSEPTVLEPKPTAVAPDAYPLTMLTYAAISPLTLSTKARADYAAFVKYAAGNGQHVGLSPGQLPIGYVPLTDSLRAQTLAAATTIKTLRAASDGSGGYYPPVTTTPSDTEVPVTTGPPTTEAVVIASTTVVDSTVPVAPRAHTLTPKTSLGGNRYAALVLLVVLCGSALVALEMTKRPLRRVLRRPGGPNEAVRS